MCYISPVFNKSQFNFIEKQRIRNAYLKSKRNSNKSLSNKKKTLYCPCTRHPTIYQHTNEHHVQFASAKTCWPALQLLSHRNLLKRNFHIRYIIKLLRLHRDHITCHKMLSIKLHSY